MNTGIFEGKTLEDALEKASLDLGMNINELQYQIIEEGSKGFFKVFSKKFKIKVNNRKESHLKGVMDQMFATEDKLSDTASTLSTNSVVDRRNYSKKEEIASSSEVINQEKIDAFSLSDSYDEGEYEDKDDYSDEHRDEICDEELIEKTKKFLAEFFKIIGIEARLDHRQSKDKVIILVFTQGSYVETDNFEEFIYALRYIISKIASIKYKTNVKFELDINEYIKKKVVKLKQLAKDISETVASEKRSIKLRPMYSNERRIIHITLKNNKDVKTKSIGNGEKKRVIISPVNL